MTFILQNGSLHFKEECKICHNNKPIRVLDGIRSASINLICSECNGKGHTIEKVEAEKPEALKYEPSDGIRLAPYREQLSIIKELEEALNVPYPTSLNEGILHRYNYAQHIIEQSIYSEGKVVTKEIVVSKT